MPVLAGDTPGIFIRLDNDDFRMAFENPGGAFGWMWSRPKRRPNDLCWSGVSVLIPEEDHQVVEQGVVDFSKNAGAQWN